MSRKRSKFRILKNFTKLWIDFPFVGQGNLDMASLTFDHEDEGDQLLAQALYVSDNEGEENNQPAASGEEYLRKVVKERKKFEDIETG